MSEKFKFLYSTEKKIFILCLLFKFIQSGVCSYGDRSNAFQNCMHWCGIKNCSNSTQLADFETNRPWYMTVLQWECWDECDYYCMWHTVKVFQYNGQGIPQFHGKWPFYRFCGIQEPASMIFSLLNGLVHFYMWKKFRSTVPKCPFSSVWNIQALLSVNAWFWSAVFHTRDVPLTEKLDYFCAFSMVLYSFYSLLNVIPQLKDISSGLLNSFGWLMWCYKHRHKHYVWKCAASVIAVNLLLLLELCDFPPWKFIIDAHALWHFGTIPVPFLWYSFLIEDCLNEMKDLGLCINLVKKMG
ncbi:Post-GPI attachment to proteins factor 3 like protein [Argiope bruennichi]|uniref:Post-GPI attachment to proteins factor 3 n=1 Tax=Argiope bruennichi TaxID=94029 RepID=A0A8T0E358_ARGBR|nr:Post-GPI attachment to proteins factor 3 like protein [Argiope bruennichi]